MKFTKIIKNILFVFKIITELSEGNNICVLPFKPKNDLVNIGLIVGNSFGAFNISSNDGILSANTYLSKGKVLFY